MIEWLCSWSFDKQLQHKSKPSNKCQYPYYWVTCLKIKKKAKNIKLHICLVLLYSYLFLLFYLFHITARRWFRHRFSLVRSGWAIAPPKRSSAPPDQRRKVRVIIVLSTISCGIITRLVVSVVFFVTNTPIGELQPSESLIGSFSD